MENESLAIIIQPAPDTSYWESGFTALIENGRLLSVQGMGGITQYEDVVGMLHKDDQTVRWQSFLWSHYAALYLLIECSRDTCLVIEGGGVLKISDVLKETARVQTSGNGAILAAKYEPVVEGELSITPEIITVGQTSDFTIQFIVGEQGIQAGGGVRIQTPYSSWSAPQMFDGAVTIEAAGDVETENSLYSYFHPMGVFGYVYQIKVARGKLESGDKIIIRYSDGKSGITVQTYPKDFVYCPSYIDAFGTGIYYPFNISDPAGVAVIAGQASKLRLAVPMVVGANIPFDAKIVILDNHYNPVFDGYNGTINLATGDKDIDVSYCLQDDDAGILTFKNLKLSNPGAQVITVRGDGLESASLVIKCTGEEPLEKLYWGAIHAHTALSDGEGDPEEYYPYGKEIGLLDFCAMSDHDWELAEHERSRLYGGFNYVQDAADLYNEPGEFVTIAGYEWMGNEGHANVYYNNNKEENPMYVGNISVVGRIGTLSFPELLSKYKGAKDVMIIPHTSHGFKWTEYDPELMPATEIYSCWGPSEFRVNPNVEGAQDGLKKGFRFGFIGGADSHHSSPGHTGKPSKYHILGWREGFAAVYASELTRDGIFDGIRHRACYATTAERILLEFYINEIPMGSNISVTAGQTLSFKALAGGTRKIKLVELLCNGEVIHSIECDT
ncbi:MAG: DUF3604 domain-containing protein, partial [Armatimonadota bacterium]